MGKVVKPWLMMALSALLVVMLLAGCSSVSKQQLQDQPKNTAVVVKIKKVVRSSISDTREYTGRLKPVQDVLVVPKLAGKVVDIPVKIGDAVKKGDLLMELDTADIQPQVNQAQAAYNVAKITVNDTKQKKKDMDDMEKKLKDQQSSLISQQKQLSDAQKQLQVQIDDINKQLADLENTKGQIPEQQYQQTKAQLEGMLKTLNDNMNKVRSGLDAVNEGLKAVQSQLSSLSSAKMQLPSDELLDAQLKQAEAGLALAKHQLGNAKIYAPIDGIVASISVEEGEMVAQTMAPVDIIDTTKLLLDIQVDENEITKLKEGQTVSVKIDAVPDQAYTGEITMVSPITDPRSQNYSVRIQIDNAAGYLKAGMFARAQLVIAQKDDVIAVPAEAVLDENGVKVVYVAKDGKAQKRRVEVGMNNSDMIEITKGLDVGEDIIVEGQQYLTDGVNITIAK